MNQASFGFIRRDRVVATKEIKNPKMPELLRDSPSKIKSSGGRETPKYFAYLEQVEIDFLSGVHTKILEMLLVPRSTLNTL